MTNQMNIYTVIAHGIVMSILTGDMIVAKMASRQLHPLVPILLMASLFDNFICFAACAFYYFAVLSELSLFLRMPLFGTRRVVFINGVFDLFHKAHQRLCREAAKRGSYLIVGVLTEEDVLKYKTGKIKYPAMTFKQRCDAIEQFPFVDEVIQSPIYLNGDDGDNFLKKHNISVVVISSEYDSPTDEYYESPRRLGMVEVLPRENGISTTELKQQVIDRCT